MRPEPDNGAALVIEPLTLLVSFWELKAFFTPQAPILLGQTDHRQSQGFFIPVLSFGLILLRGAYHAYQAAYPPFRCGKLLTGMNNGGLAELLYAQALGFKKSRLSFRISLSSSNSATIFLSRSFSF